MAVKNIWIYHELQESQLCGQHCLNNLLQGPHFTAPDLAAIAEELGNVKSDILIDLCKDRGCSYFPRSNCMAFTNQTTKRDSICSKAVMILLMC